jgi:WD40 repeat protein
VEEDRLKIVTLPNGPSEEMPLEEPTTEGDGDVLITVAPDWLRIHRDGRTIAGTYGLRTVIWDTGAAKLRDLTSPMLMDASSLQWSRSGIVAWRDRHSGVWAWSDTSGEPVTLEAERWPGRALRFAPAGPRVAMAADGEAAIWDSRTGRKLVTLTGPGSSKALQIAWSPDGRRVVTSSDDGVLRFWNASNGRLLASIYALADDDTRDWLLLTPDGRLDGSERALATVVAWRTGDRVSLDKRLTERRRVRNLWRSLSAGGSRR